MIRKVRVTKNATDESARQIMDSLRRLVQIVRVSSREAEKKAGISGAQLFVLSKLADADEALSVNDLAERTLTHQSSVSVVVSKLVERGLVERVLSPEDRRKWDLTLTSAGKALMRRAPQVAQDRLIEVLENLPVSRRQQLAAVLSDVISGIGGEGEAPEMFLESERNRKGANYGSRS